MENVTKLHDDFCSSSQHSSVGSRGEELTPLQRNDRIEFLKQRQEVLKEKLNKQSTTKVDGSIATSILEINDLSTPQNSEVNKATPTAPTNVSVWHSTEDEENHLADASPESTERSSVTLLNSSSSGKINIISLNSVFKGKNNSITKSSQATISLKDYVSKLPECIDKDKGRLKVRKMDKERIKNIRKNEHVKKDGESVKNTKTTEFRIKKHKVTIDLTDIDDNDCQKKIFSVKNDQSFIKNSNIVHNDGLIVNSLKNTIENTPSNSTIMSSNALRFLSANKHSKVPLSLSLSQYTNAINSSKRPSSLPIKRIYPSTNKLIPGNLLNIACEVSVGHTTTNNTKALAGGLCSLLKSNISTVEQNTLNGNLDPKRKTVGNERVSTFTVPLISTTISNSDQRILPKEVKTAPSAAVAIPTEKSHAVTIRECNVQETIRSNKIHFETCVTRDDLGIHNDASNTNVPNVQCKPSSLPIAPTSSSISNTTTQHIYTLKGVTTRNLNQIISLREVLEKSGKKLKPVLGHQTPVGNVQPIMRSINSNVNKAEGKTHEAIAGKTHEAIAGKTHEAIAGKPHEAIAGKPHEAIAGKPHEAIAGKPHEAIAGKTHEAMTGKIHEAMTGKTHEAMTGKTHKAMAGKTHEAMAGKTHEAMAGKTHEAMAGKTHEAMAGKTHEAMAGKTHEAMAGKTHEAMAGKTHDAMAGKTHDAMAGKTHDAMAGKTHDAMAGKTHDAMAGKTHDAMAGKTHDAMAGKTHDAMAGKTHYAMAGKTHYAMAGKTHYAMAGKTHDAMAGKTHDAMAGKTHDAMAGKTHDAMAGKTHDAMAGKTHDAMAGKTHDAMAGKTHDAMAGKTHDAMSGKTHDAMAGKTQGKPTMQWQGKLKVCLPVRMTLC